MCTFRMSVVVHAHGIHIHLKAFCLTEICAFTAAETEVVNAV